VIGMVMAWLTRARDEATATAGGANTVLPPKPLLIFGLIGTGFFVVAAIACAFSNEGRRNPALPFLFVALSLLGAPFIAEYRNARHRVLVNGLRYGRMFGKGGLMRWKEVTAAEYSPHAKWFRLVSTSGEVARISAAAIGLPTFARTVLDNVPAQSIDAKSRAIFEQTAGGRPQSLWM
jgi:hypothetical protein